MTDVRQLQDDLHYVREAVARREHPRGPFSIYYLWAAYVLVGYTLIDVAPKASGWFFLIGGTLGGIASAYLGRRYSRRTGEFDRDHARRTMLHFTSIVLAVASAIALSMVIPELRG